MIHVEVDGRLFTFKQLAEKYGLPKNLIASRYQRGLRELEKLVQPKYDILRK